MECYLFKVPTINKVLDGVEAVVNGYTLPLDLKGTGADMLKQIIEFCFHIPEPIFPMGYQTSYKYCERAIQIANGRVLLGIDRYVQDGQYKYYIVHMPIRSIRYGVYMPETITADEAFETLYETAGMFR